MPNDLGFGGTSAFGGVIETPVSEDYNRTSSKFTGKIDKVTITLKKIKKQLMCPFEFVDRISGVIRQAAGI